MPNVELKIWNLTMINEKTKNEDADGRSDSNAVLARVANIAHHGGLLGFTTTDTAMREIARLTLAFWDKDECHRLQCKGKSVQRRLGLTNLAATCRKNGGF